MRLIDADLLKGISIKDKLERNHQTFNLDDAYEEGWFDAIETIEKQPTVDAEPIRHGHWTRTEAYPHRVVCSECHRTYVRNENIIEGRYKGDEIVPIYCTEAEYCPHCGAKMDGVEE